jgi:hypothetical protein
MRQNVHAILLVLLIELLWVRIDTNGWYSPGQWQRSATRISAGFPVPAVSFTVHRTTGNMPPWTNYPERSEWRPGLRMFPLSQVAVGVSAVAVFFGIRWLLRFDTARTVFEGIVVGVAFGILTSLATRPPTRTEADDPVTWLNGVWTFIALPSAICFLARRASSWRQPLLLLAVIVAVFPWASLWCDQFKAAYRHAGGATSRRILEPSLEDMVIAPLMVGCMVLGLVFLMRRFVPVFRRHEPVA